VGECQAGAFSGTEGYVLGEGFVHLLSLPGVSWC